MVGLGGTYAVGAGPAMPMYLLAVVSTNMPPPTEDEVSATPTGNVGNSKIFRNKIAVLFLEARNVEMSRFIFESKIYFWNRDIYF